MVSHTLIRLMPIAIVAPLVIGLPLSSAGTIPEQQNQTTTDRIPVLTREDWAAVPATDSSMRLGSRFRRRVTLVVMFAWVRPGLSGAGTGD